MTKLHDLYEQQGQSPWVDNITRPSLRGGGLADLVTKGIRGVTSNPTIFAKAIEAGDDYDEQFAKLLENHSVEDAYWELTITDINDALDVLRPMHEESGSVDGFVSIEVSPVMAHDTKATTEAARRLHERIDRPNLYVKIPGTKEGLPAIRTMFSEGRNINITLLFSLVRYGEVIDAYLSGLEDLVAAGTEDLSDVHSVASFFVSRVDTEVDRRLEQIAGESNGSRANEVLELRGKAAVAQAKMAYKLFRERFSGARWQALSERGREYSDLYGRLRRPRTRLTRTSCTWTPS